MAALKRREMVPESCCNRPQDVAKELPWVPGATLGTLRSSGIPLIGDVPWGTHFCQFYQTEQDLVDVLVPYFAEGLRHNEFCMWVTSEPLECEQAASALKRAVPDLDRRIKAGQIEILPYTEWYLINGVFVKDPVLQGWVDKLEAALARGYEGLRLSGNTFWLEDSHWNDFTDYEEAVDSVIGRYRMIALCTYSLNRCGASEIADVISNHRYALMKRHGRWSVIESSGHKHMIEELAEARSTAESLAAELSSFVSSMADGAYLVDAEHNVRWMNGAGREILGVPPGSSPDEWIRGLARRDIHGRPLPPERAPFVRALKGEEIRDARYKVVTPDGREITLGVSASPVRDADGRIVGASVVFRDQTDRLALEQRERRIAEVLQQAVVPPEILQDIPGYEVAARYQPALREAEIGGDFYDVFKLPGNKIGLLIGDVAGKGLEAAMHVSAIRYTIRSYSFMHPEPGKVVGQANEILSAESSENSRLATVFFGIINPGDSTMTYTSAGHPPPILCDGDGRAAEMETPRGIPLGVLPRQSYPVLKRKLQPGETLVVVTDGITEAGKRDAVLFGHEGIIHFLALNHSLSPDELASDLLEAATHYAGGNLQDDAAIIVLRRSVG